MIRRPPRTTRTDTLFPYTTLFRSLRHIALDVADVTAAEALGNENVERPADQAVARVAEYPLGLGVHKLDAPLSVDDDDGIRRPPQHCAELRLAVAQRLFRLLGVGDVAHGGDDQRALVGLRSEERRVGKEWVSPFKSREVPYH